MTNADIIAHVRANVAELVAAGDAEENADGTFRLTDVGIMRQQVAALGAYVTRLHALIDGASVIVDDFKNPWVTVEGVAATLDGWDAEAAAPPLPPRPDVTAPPAPAAKPQRVVDSHPGQYL